MNLQSRTTESGPENLRFTEAELSAVLDTAMARQREADLLSSSLEDAKEIARSLNIPEEHVVAAAEEIIRRRGRDKKREAARAKRRTGFLLTLMFTVPAQLFLVLTVLSGHDHPWRMLLLAVLIALPQLATFWRWKSGPISDLEADAQELPPVAGTCRVCGLPAANDRATFCDAHQYRGPSAG